MIVLFLFIINILSSKQTSETISHYKNNAQGKKIEVTTQLGFRNDFTLSNASKDSSSKINDTLGHANLSSQQKQKVDLSGIRIKNRKFPASNTVQIHNFYYRKTEDTVDLTKKHIYQGSLKPDKRKNHPEDISQPKKKIKISSSDKNEQKWKDFDTTGQIKKQDSCLTNEAACNLQNALELSQIDKKIDECMKRNGLVFQFLLTERCRIMQKISKQTEKDKINSDFFQKNPNESDLIINKIIIIFDVIEKKEKIFYDEINFAFDKAEQEAYKLQYNKRSEKSNATPVQDKKDEIKDNLKNDGEPSINDLSTSKRNKKNSRHKILLDKNGKYTYSDLTYENLLKDCLVLKDEISFTANDFQLFLYVNKLSNLKIVIDETNEVDFFTNFLLTNKIIDFERFLQIIEGQKTKININGFENFSILREKLCRFIETNKSKIRLILPSCMLFEEYIKTYENDIDINSVPAVTYIYFSHLFEKILEFDWNDYIVKLFKELKEIFTAPNQINKDNGFLFQLKKNYSKLTINYFFLIRVKSEINKIFFLLIKPFLKKKTLSKYALIMFFEHSENFKNINRHIFDVKVGDIGISPIGCLFKGLICAIIFYLILQ
ncbi:hypothetical protein GVAV_003391 [Gurleya vavrai]